MIRSNSTILIKKKKGCCGDLQILEFVSLIFIAPWHLTLIYKLNEKWPVIER